LCFCHHKAHQVSIWGLRLLHEADDISAVYVPSTMVASGGVASTTCAMVSAWGRGADSSTAGDGSSSPATALGSSPSQDRSVDFLHSTTLVISQARLPTYMYYSKIDFTHKLDRTIVTVRVPIMLAISTSPASTGAPFSAWATTGSTTPVVAEALASFLLMTPTTCQQQSPAVPPPSRFL
jgi:hypothetical protein